MLSGHDMGEENKPDGNKLSTPDPKADKMVEPNTNPTLEQDESEFDFYLQFEWPEHIETALRRLLWTSLVEAAEPSAEHVCHTSYIRWIIATHPETPAPVLDFLATIGSPPLLERIAENTQTSAATLTRLAQCATACVRCAVSDNSSTPVEILRQLLVDEDADVRYAMAENPALPAKLLQQLCTDQNVYVATRAARTICRRNPATVKNLIPRSNSVANGEKKFG